MGDTTTSQNEYDHDEDRDYYSVLSDAAYTYGDNVRSGKSQEESKSLAEQHMRDYGYMDNIDIPLSGKGDVATVTTGGHKGGATVAYKGTSNLNDVANWGGLVSRSDEKFSVGGMWNMAKRFGLRLFGQKDRYEKADDLYDAVKKQHDKVGITGHSLGGALAVMQGRRSGVKSYSFNPGMVDVKGWGYEAKHREYCERTGKCEGEAAQEIYSTGKDLVSSTGDWFDRDGRGIGQQKDIVHNYSSEFKKTIGGYSETNLPLILQHDIGYFLPDKKKHKDFVRDKERGISGLDAAAHPKGHKKWDLGGKMAKVVGKMAARWYYPDFAERDNDIEHMISLGFK